MDQEDLYDQFGNYIGPEILSEDSSEERPNHEQQKIPQGVQQVLPVANEHRIVLHEDKKFYQSHEEMYPGAQIMIEQEDRQSLETPLVSTEAEKCYDYQQNLQTYYQTQYLLDLLHNSNNVRNICVAGHLHHGKTVLMDMLVQQTHIRSPDWNLQKNYKWLDSRIDEQDRQLSIKATPISLLLPDIKGKHYVVNFMDAPGHPNFLGETVAGMRACDGVLLVVDAIEGVMLMTEKLIKHILRERLGVVVVINKIDRLIIEMKIPPEDAYLKLKHTLEEINGLFLKCSQQFGLPPPPIISPLHDNVLFASGQYAIMFSLSSFAHKYKERFPDVIPEKFAMLLWGDFYFNKETRKFQNKPTQGQRKRVFVEFILEPIYKIFSHAVGKDRKQLQQFLSRNLQLYLTPQQYKLNIKTLIKLIMKRYFGQNKCLAQSLVKNVEAPHVRAEKLVKFYYRGLGQFKELASKGKSDGPLLLNIVKLYHTKDYKTFYSFGRIISGTLKKGDRLRIMGQNYISGDQEDLFVKTAGKIYLLQGRYRQQIQQAVAGNLVLIEGIDQAITKTATITHADAEDTDIMIPLKFWSQPTIKVAIEPLVPSELPKMMEAIRRVNKSYLLLKTKVQESGEHILIGNGELHLDCILHDIRLLYSDIQCRISDPTVTFSETVTETSGIPCYADTPNRKNRIKALAGPLQRGIAEHVEKQLLDVNNPKDMKNFLQTKYDWDILASSNVWSFGPETYGTNILLNDSLASGANQSGLNRIKQSVVQGFRWSTRQGPLCDEPMRNVKFRVMDADLSQVPTDCPPGQMIPTARRAFYSAFLTANPRIMEPVYYTQIQCTTKQSIEAVFAVLAKRRGSVQNDVPKVGTPHYIIKALIPCIEALGFETDLRVHTVGQAFCLSTFDHWQTLPGDPLDKRIVLKPLQVHEPHEIARQFMIKTRRRKGLNEQVSIVKYFDDLNIKELLKNDASFKDFI